MTALADPGPDVVPADDAPTRAGEPGMTQGGEAMDRKKPRPTGPGQGGGGAVYGLGMIGALIWYWRQADTGGEKAFAVLKAFAWPTFVVYDLMDALARMKSSR